MHGCDPSIVGAILLSPPLRFSRTSDLQSWARVGQAPGRPGARARRLPAARGGAASASPSIPQAEVIAVDSAKHLWVGYAERVLDEIVRVVNPAAYPLPTSFEETT